MPEVQAAVTRAVRVSRTRLQATQIARNLRRRGMAGSDCHIGPRRRQHDLNALREPRNADEHSRPPNSVRSSVRTRQSSLGATRWSVCQVSPSVADFHREVALARRHEVAQGRARAETRRRPSRRWRAPGRAVSLAGGQDAVGERRRMLRRRAARTDLDRRMTAPRHGLVALLAADRGARRALQRDVVELDPGLGPARRGVDRNGRVRPVRS